MMEKNANIEALLKKLQKDNVIVAYCCCGTKRTNSTSC